MESTLANNIVFYRKSLSLTQQELGEIIGVKRTNIGHYEKGMSIPPVPTLIKLAKAFGISTDTLLGLSSGTNNRTATGQLADPINIFVPIKDQKKYLEDLYSSGIALSIPGLEGETRTFEIDGDSMVPIIFPSDLVIGKRINDFEEIKKRVPYIVVSPTIGIIVRYIEHEEEVLNLVTDDTINFPSIKCPKTEVKEIWEAISRITNQFLHPRHYSNEKNLIERIKRLEDKED